MIQHQNTKIVSSLLQHPSKVTEEEVEDEPGEDEDKEDKEELRSLNEKLQSEVYNSSLYLSRY